MRNKMDGKRFVLHAAVLAGLAVFNIGTASAGEWFVGAGVGGASLDGIEDVLVGTGFDDSDTGFKISGGYRLLDFLAVEVVYTDFGTFVGSASGGTPQTTLRDNWQATALSANAVGILNLGEYFSLFAKVGLSAWQVDDEVTFGTANFSTDADGADVNFGVGAGFNIGKHFTVQAEYERFTGFGDENTNLEEGAEVDLVSVSGVLRF
jgi:OmpA-OmpF porin, OOP family